MKWRIFDPHSRLLVSPLSNLVRGWVFFRVCSPRLDSFRPLLLHSFFELVARFPRLRHSGGRLPETHAGYFEIRCLMDVVVLSPDARLRIGYPRLAAMVSVFHSLCRRPGFCLGTELLLRPVGFRDPDSFFRPIAFHRKFLPCDA